MCKTRNHKKPLEITVDLPPEPGMPAHVTVEFEAKSCVKGLKRTKFSSYWVEVIAAESGFAYRFKKIWDGDDFVLDGEEGQITDVNIDHRHGVHQCSCKGFKRWERCRHVDAAIELFNLGYLVKSQSKPETKSEPWCRHCNDVRGVYCSWCSI